MPKSVGNHVHLTLKDWTRTHLELWSEQQGRPLANMANWIIENAIKSAIERGELKAVKTDDSMESLALTYIKALSGGSIDILDLQRLADEIQTESEVLAKILKQAQEGRNGKPA